MKTLFANATVYENGTTKKMDLFFDGVSLFPVSSDSKGISFDNTIDGVAVFPGFCDVHVHFREPGFSYKETIRSGSLAAAAGGFTSVLTMPNLNPVPDSTEHLKAQLDIIERDAVISVTPYGAITVGECGIDIADLEGMADRVAAFSDDGRGVQSEEMMLEAMRRAKALGKIIAAHCEDNSLLRGGYVHDGEYARRNGHKGICSESEWGPIKRDVELLLKSGAAYHVCHVSTKESVDIIRDAKMRGVNITAETAPHYLTLDDSHLIEDARFKMNPPLRDKSDREALIEGVLDGTIDMIATDHAPHSAEEKSRGLALAPMGVTGIELSFPVMYTNFVKSGIMDMNKLLELMVYKPRERFGISSDIGYTVFKLDEEFTVEPERLVSMGHSTPFANERLFGKCLLTVYDGKCVYADERLK